MTDRELLKAAATAAGYPIHSDAWARVDGGETLFMGNGGPAWNPLTDDGDALRLLNALDLELRHVHLKAHAGRQDQFWTTVEHGADKDAAARRAIVRAAAVFTCQRNVHRAP